jgi:hypothetical protein
MTAGTSRDDRMTARLRALGVVVAAVAVALTGAALGLLWLNGAVASAVAGSEPWVDAVSVVMGLAPAVAGVVIVVKRPRNLIGWILLVAPVAILVESLGVAAVTYTHLVRQEPSTATEVLAAIGDALWLPAYGLTVTWLFLLFPDGRVPGPRWRWLLVITGGAAAVYLVVTLLADAPLYALPSVRNPLGVGGDARLFETTQTATIAVVILSAPVAVVSLVQRWRRSRGDEREQLKWLVWGAALFVATLFAAIPFSDRVPVASLLPDLGVVAVVAAIAVAVLRYRLYDIDRIVSRTVTYVLVTGVLAAVYVLGVVGMQTVLGPLVGDSDLIVAGSTLVVAALFGPVRRRVQATVDRRFNRRRYDAAKAVESFGQRLRDEVDLDQVAADLGSVVGATVQPATLSLWLRPEGGSPR